MSESKTRELVLERLTTIGPLTVPDLKIELPELTGHAIYSALRRLHAAGVVRIRSWHRYIGETRRGGSPSPVWGLADGKADAPRPSTKDYARKATLRYSRKNAVKLSVKRRTERHGVASPFYQMLYKPLGWRVD